MSMLVEYIKDYRPDFNGPIKLDSEKPIFKVVGHPIGVVVALSPDHIGVAICSEKDQFKKDVAKEIAAGRAIKGGHLKIPRRIVATKNLKIVTMNAAVQSVVDKMYERASRYFK